MKQNKIKLATFLATICISFIVFSCNKQTKVDIKVTYLDPTIPNYNNSSNPNTNSQIHLGRVLFYDKNLSLNNSISCASCHKQSNAFADNTAFSKGYENRETKRNSIAIQNIGNNFIMSNGFVQSFSNLFWDGRETNINSLVSKPINNHIEMGISDTTYLLNKLNKIPYYNNLVNNAFGTSTLTMSNLSEAVAAFLTNITTINSKFDQVQMNSSTIKFNALEQRGQQLFHTTYQCAKCHEPMVGTYNNTTQNAFANIGLDINSNDVGREKVSNLSTDKGAFKIPDLHNVALTAPYMHDGRFKTLDEVLDHYSSNIKSNPNLDNRLQNADGTPISMNIKTEDRKALITFLNTLTDFTIVTNPNLSNPFKTK